jgi:hypothetical protein
MQSEKCKMGNGKWKTKEGPVMVLDRQLTLFILHFSIFTGLINCFVFISGKLS